MRKSGFVLLAMGVGAVGVFVACSSSNSSNGGGGDGGASSSSGGASSGGFSLTNCPSVGGLTATCASCIETSCASQLAAINTACAATFSCACPAGADAAACGAPSATCIAALQSAAACTACNTACGATSSSSGGSSSGSSGGSSGGSGSTDAGCSGVGVLLDDSQNWCTVSIAGTIASGTETTTVSTGQAYLCVTPNSTVTLSATPNTGFVLGQFMNPDGGLDTATDGGDAGAVIETTFTVGASGTSCTWICCPGVGGSPACTQTGCQ